MKISTKGRYALQMMTDLAEHSRDGFVPLKDVAERQGISKNYLEQIIMQLNRDTDWLEATRGSSGGYRLSKAPELYTVGDIMRLTEGSVLPDECEMCHSTDCSTHGGRALKVWRGLDRVMREYLDAITLRDVLDGSETLRCSVPKSR
ncbi:MAG: Rrf2 family transcriptional regulator [Oscillospiraceae bacterium]|jgi:Rrf2 family protein|nr:Rrf2 family transcriptional regulator [Oscillospiraceae bacterium]